MIDIKHCIGCVDDFYNGHNSLGVQDCWMRKDAKLIPSVLIHRDQAPPYLNLKVISRPTCYRMKEHSTVKPESIGADGYWK